MKIILLFLLFFFSIKSISQNLQFTVHLTGFDSKNGKVFLVLLDKNEKEIDKKIASISNNKAIVVFNIVKSGFYAVKAFHDANNNQKLDTNLLGIPKEKWGVSNNIRGSFGPPDFKKMLFEVKENTSILIKLK